MAIRLTVQNENPSLKKLNVKVTAFADPELQQVIVDLRETMVHEGLVGMAAPQIDEHYQIFVTEPRQTDARPADQSDQLRVYINPKIVKFSSEKCLIYEGCGSVKHSQVFGPVWRAKQVTVEALDQFGQKFRLTCDGLLSRIVQHELDHLNGMEFVDRLEKQDEVVEREVYLAKIKNSPELLAASKITMIEVERI